MKKRSLVMAVLLGILFGGAAAAQTEAEKILAAVVKIRAVVPETARTAETLGTEREGSGVVIDSEGHVLTIGYLILEAAEVEITETGAKPIKATVVGYDHPSGFGLLRADRPLRAPFLALGNSAEISTGDPLLVAGFGGREAAQGVRVVSLTEFAGSWEYLLDRAIFTAPPHAEFSGAALIDRSGRLAGIGSLFTQIQIKEIGMVPANMFVPVDLLKPILSDLQQYGHSRQAPRPWLGIRAESIHGRVFVLGVSPGGPSEKAGIMAGDLVLAVKEKAVRDLADFYRSVWALGAAGVDVPLSLLQDIRIRQIVVHSADRAQYMRLNPKRTASSRRLSFHTPP
ncbi:MAG: S1C family serine protease [Thermodesulfobacteriota bacterium]